MAKENKEDLKALLTSTKEELGVAKTELRAFEKESKLAKDTDHSDDAKHGKRWSKLKATVTKKEELIAKTREKLAALKPEKTERPSKYEYPKDVVTALDKKKHRAKLRAEAKRAEKEAAAPKKDKKAKEGKKEEKTGKSKKEKKAKEEETED